MVLVHRSMIGSNAQPQKNNMQKLSVVIITFNEEANIAACIESVKEIADEIIVVDSFSTDKTVDISRSAEAIVILNKFEGYTEQKNFALEKCSHPFVLSLDADERLDKDSLRNIREQKEKDFSSDGYYLKRITFVGKTPVKHGSWYPDKKIRLVKKELANWKGKGVHEYLDVNSTNTFTLDGHILHYSYKNVDELFEKTRKYSELAAKHLHSKGRKISGLGIYAKAYGRFFKHYFLKMGFLSGNLGWQIGRQQYCEALWKYQMLKKLNKE